MNELALVVALHDVDELLASTQDPTPWKRMGFDLSARDVLERERARLADTIERRWIQLYERSRQRYGRGLTGVRERVCQGCFVTLPTSAAPPPGLSQLHACESCGRLLYWT